MLLAFIDESYTKTRYYMGALVVPEDQAIPLTASLDKVVSKAAVDFGTPEEAELHGHPLFHGLADWELLRKKPRALIGIYNGAFQTISEARVSIILRGLDITAQRVRYPQPDPPHQVVLGHLLERIDEYASRRNELVLVIADEINDEDRYRRDLRWFQRNSTWGYRARRLSRIVDTIHFAPSEASRLLQAADLVTFLYQRRSVTRETDPRAQRASDALWARVQDQVEHCWTWTP